MVQIYTIYASFSSFFMLLLTSSDEYFCKLSLAFIASSTAALSESVSLYVDVELKIAKNLLLCKIF